MSTGEMFDWVTDTWNPVKGCKHNCTYCWASNWAEKRLKYMLEAYQDGFQPKIIPSRLHYSGKNESVFVSDMGDLFGSWVPADWIIKVIQAVKEAHSSNTFLFLTKNPQRYLEFEGEFPDNCVLGATIETNRNQYIQSLSNAPKPADRYRGMRLLDFPSKFISIEPIVDFDVDIFLRWVEEIAPVKVAVGYDNYGHQLVEPGLSKTNEFMERMRESGIPVREKTIREKCEPV